jgi:hypothetical protein
MQLEIGFRINPNSSSHTHAGTDGMKDALTTYQSPIDEIRR